jgi:hypothetical protein
MTILRQGEYTTTAGDSLFAANGVAAIPADGYTLATGLTGKLLRGFPLKQGATPFELTPVTADADVVVAVLAEDVANAATDLPIVAYQGGEFNKYAIERALTAAASTATVAGLTVKARVNGIFFKDVVKGV